MFGCVVNSHRLVFKAIPYHAVNKEEDRLTQPGETAHTSSLTGCDENACSVAKRGETQRQNDFMRKY